MQAGVPYFDVKPHLSLSTSPQQEDLVKLSEKCGLSSAGSSPAVTPLRTPEDLKSNILKAQVEAAALKVNNGSGVKCSRKRREWQDERHSRAKL